MKKFGEEMDETESGGIKLRYGLNAFRFSLFLLVLAIFYQK
jgi:hypothetical protein